MQRRPISSLLANLAALAPLPRPQDDGAPELNTGVQGPDTSECINVSRDPVLVQVTSNGSCEEIPVGCTEIVHVTFAIAAGVPVTFRLEPAKGVWKVEKIIDEGSGADVTIQQFTGVSKNPFGFQPGNDSLPAGAFSGATDRRQLVTQFSAVNYDAGVAPMMGALPEIKPTQTSDWIFTSVAGGTANFRLVLRKLRD